MKKDSIIQNITRCLATLFFLLSTYLLAGMPNAYANVCAVDVAYFSGTLFPVDSSTEPVQTMKIGFPFCVEDSKPYLTCVYKGNAINVPVDSLKSIQLDEGEAILTKWDGIQVISKGCNSKGFTYSVTNPITNEVTEEKGELVLRYLNSRPFKAIEFTTKEFGTMSYSSTRKKWFPGEYNYDPVTGEKLIHKNP